MRKTRAIAGLSIAVLVAIGGCQVDGERGGAEQTAAEEDSAVTAEQTNEQPQAGGEEPDEGDREADSESVAVSFVSPEAAWRVASASNVHSAIRIGEGAVYFGAGDRGLRRIDAQSGTHEWIFVSDGIVRTQIEMTDELVVFGPRGMGGRVTAVDKQTGEWVWSTDLEGYTTTAPLVSGDTIYVQTTHKMYALNLFDGSELWGQPRERRRDRVLALLLLEEEEQIVSVEEDLLVFRDVRDGRVVSSHEAGDVILTHPIRAGELLYVVTRDEGRVRAFNLETREWEWDRVLGYEPQSQTAVADGKLFVRVGSIYLYALDLEDGSVVWNRNVGTDGSGVAIYSDTFLLILSRISSDLGALSMHSAQDGEELWRVELPRMHQSYGAPIVRDGLVAVGIEGLGIAEDLDNQWEEGHGVFAVRLGEEVDVPVNELPLTIEASVWDDLPFTSGEGMDFQQAPQ